MSKRIDIIDQLRGHFLLAIQFDHMAGVLGPSIFLFFNGNGNLWVSAAEGFVFLSGFIWGFLSFSRSQKPIKEILISIFKRSLNLYFISVFLTIFYSLFFWEAPLPRSGVLVNTTPSTWEIIYNSFLLKHFFGWADILSLYVYLLIIAIPFILLIYKKKYTYALILSFILWLLNILQLTPQLNISIFSVFSWQLLFNIGIILGSRFDLIQSLFEKIKNNKFLLLIILFSFVLSIFGGIYFPKIEILNIDIFNKEFLQIGRLLITPIWLISLTIIIYFLGQKIPFLFKGLYLFLGKRSLLVYGLQSLILVLFYYTFPYSSNNFNNTIFQILGVLLLIFMAISLEFINQKFRTLLIKLKKQ